MTRSPRCACDASAVIWPRDANQRMYPAARRRMLPMRSARLASVNARKTSPEQSKRLGPSVPTRYAMPRYCFAAAITFSMRCCAGVSEPSGDAFGAGLEPGCLGASGGGDALGAGEAEGAGLAVAVGVPVPWLPGLPCLGC